MPVILRRLVIVILFLLALFVGSQWALYSLAQHQLLQAQRESMLLVLDARAPVPGGEDVTWRFAVCDNEKYVLDDRPSSLDELEAAIRKGGGHLTIVGRNVGAESRWNFRVDTEGAATLDGLASSIDQLRAKLNRFIEEQKKEPTLRLELRGQGRTALGEPFGGVLAIGEGGKVTLDGEPFSVDDYLARLGGVVDAGWAVAVADDGKMTADGRPFSADDLKERLERFVKLQAAERKARRKIRLKLQVSQGGEGKKALWTFAILERRKTETVERGLSLGDFAMRIASAKVAAKIDVESKDSLVVFRGSGGIGGEKTSWTLTVPEEGPAELTEEGVSLAGFLARLKAAKGPLRIEVDKKGTSTGWLELTGQVTDAGWTVAVDRSGAVTLDGRPYSVAELRDRLAAFAKSQMTQPTRPVTVADVLAAKIPTPTLSRVSTAGMSFEQAFPKEWFEHDATIRRGPVQAAAEGEVVVVRSYAGAPILHDREQQKRKKWDIHFPEKLPPVEERLPLYPAVVRGPDGVGHYDPKGDMLWRRCTQSVWDITRKLGYESFVRFGPSGELQPCLAYKWEVKDDNRVFTFYLRKGHRWSDGEPFTAHDIAWVCNVNIGSPHWSDPPDWMSATDGWIMLYVDDILDWAGLAAKIRGEAESSRPSPGKRLWALADARLKERLSAISPANLPDEETRTKIVQGLGTLFRSEGFYAPEAWQDVDLAGEVAELEQKASRLSKSERDRLTQLLVMRDLLRQASEGIGKLEPAEVSQLNLHLFRSAYPGLVDKAKKERVKVETVPDENGDDSHIIRFTFKKPMSFFLEKTGTFMFYRGLFSISPHFHGKLFHPEGSKILNLIDIYDWAGLFRKIREQAEAPDPSPGKRVWALLGEDMRKRLAEAPPTAKSADAYKQEIVDELNRILTDRTFYDAASWSGVDLSKEMEHLRKKGFSELKVDQRTRLVELMVRLDLAKRGPADLDEEELLRFNQEVFRAAYAADLSSDKAKETDGLVATSRTGALDTAAQTGPKKYTSWTNRMRAAASYHPKYNPHTPLLQAWRIVSEDKDRECYAVRNPYYYRVDEQGNQLPYIDCIETTKEAQKNVRVQAMLSGNVDFQARDVEFEDFTVLKQSEARGEYEIRLWAQDYVGELTFWPLQSHKDPEYRKLQDDPRFRRALSLAVNRQEMIDVVWRGMGEPAQFSVPEGSPYYDAKHRYAYVNYDPAGAGRLLDEVGLDKRGADGMRLYPSGRPLILDVNTPPDRPLAAVQMLCNYWQAVGLNAQMKVRTASAMNRLGNLQTLDIGIHKEGGNYFGPVLAGAYAPIHPAECGQYPDWVSWLRNGGQSGEEPPDRVKALDALWDKVVTAPNEDEKIKAWKVVSALAADEIPLMGVTTSPGKVIYVKRGFRNVPKLSLAGWIAHEPGNNCPEVFFKD